MKKKVAFYTKGQTSPLGVIAGVIAKAMKAMKPETRYVKGKLARPMMFIRKWFGGRAFDKVVMNQVK